MVMGKVMVGVVFFGMMVVAMVYGQPPGIEWERTYGGNHWEHTFSVQQTTDWGYILAGETESFGAGSNDVYLVKTDDLGNMLWSRTYGGAGSDVGKSVYQTVDSGYIIAGYTSSFGSGDSDMYLIKTDSQGDMLWSRTYGRPNSSDRVHEMQQTSDRGYILAGETLITGYWPDYYLVKTDSLGDTLWTNTYGGSNYDVAWSVDQTDDGGYMLAGITYSFGAQYGDVYVVKTDGLGNTLWTRFYEIRDIDLAMSIRQTMGGNYILVGTVEDYYTAESDMLIMKLDNQGDTLWTRIYGGNSQDVARAVEQTSDGNFLVVGSSSFLSDVIKINNSGDILWGINVQGFFQAFDQTFDGGYIIAGSIYVGGTYTDSYLVKTEPEIYIPFPVIQVSESLLDFDQVLVNHQEELPFLIYNVGDTTLQVFDIVSDDSCFFTDFDPDSGLVEEGDSLQVNVVFHPQDLTNYSATLNIISNAQATLIDVEGEGIPWIHVSNNYLIFGVVYQGNLEQLPLVLHNICDTTVVIRDISTNDLSFTTDYDPADSLILPNDSLQLTVTFMPHDNIVYQSALCIESNRGSLNVDLLGVGISSLMTSTGLLQFNNVFVGQQSQLPLILHNVGDTTVCVYDITITDPVYTTDFDPSDSLIVPGDSLQITVTFSPEDTTYYLDTLTFMGYYEETSVVLVGHGVEPSSVGDWLSGIPTECALYPVYPNPFNTQAVIRYDVPVAGEVEMVVYDVLGRRVAMLVDGIVNAGRFRVVWDGGDLTSGIYFVRMEAGELVMTRKAVILK